MNKQKKTLILQIVLFLVTVVTTTLAGAEWQDSKFLFFVNEEHLLTWDDFLGGFRYSIPFLLILTCHEFGHYFTAKYHRIKVTLPFYIPLWFGFLVSPSFGTMGAFIRIKEVIQSRKHYFDVGVAGPLAGFVVALVVIIYGYTHLPPAEAIYKIHPEYEAFGLDYPNHVYSYEYARKQDSLSYLSARAIDSVAFVKEGKISEWSFRAYEPQESYSNMYFSKPLLFHIAEKYLVEDKSRIPLPQEIMHNPYLLAGLLALFFTALNLLPIGQLDGGHIIFGLFSEKYSRMISIAMYSILVFFAGLGIVSVPLIVEALSGNDFGSLFLLIGYIYFLYTCTFSFLKKTLDRWTFAAVMVAIQFAVHTYTGSEGYMGWLFFAFFLGRFIGIVHPKVLDQSPLSNGRIALGVFAILVFILSFSPEPFVMEF
jgi:Zn-dependent protease